MRALLLALLVLALGACRNPVDETPVAMFTVTVSDWIELEWPYLSGDTVRLNNSFDEEAGLAGIEVEITDVAAGLVRTHRFSASDLEEGVTPCDVPENGTAYALLRLTQDGKVVATGVAEWALQPAIQWEVEIERSPYPYEAFIDEADLNQAQQRCGRGCQRVWRFDISEDAVNYPDEALWLLLWGVDPTVCHLCL